jgi:hypothetical protein
MGEQVLKLNAQGLIPCQQDLGMDVSVGGDLTVSTHQQHQTCTAGRVQVPSTQKH